MRLALVTGPLLLPGELAPPVLPCVLGGGLHLFAEAAGGTVHHGRLDPGAAEIEILPDLPIRLAGAGVTAEELVVTGPASALGVGPDGAVRWQAALPTARARRGPWPLGRSDRATVLWEGGEGASLGWMELQRGAVGPVSSLSWADPVELGGCAMEDGAVLFATRSGELELLQLATGSLVRRRPIREAALAYNVNLLPAPGGWAVVWSTPLEIRLLGLDFEFQPLGPVEVLSAVEPPVRFGSVRAAASAAGTLAVLVALYLPEGSADELTVEQRLTLYDPSTRCLGPATAVPLGAPYGGLVWLGETLALLHGEARPALSLYRTSSL